jgi:hypothetical protein
MESSFKASGSILGVDIKDTGTYSTLVRPDGTQYGEGQGVMVTKEGEMATWTGHGVGAMNKDGTASYRGAIYLQTMPAQLSRLKRIAVLFEYHVDGDGHMRSDYWEWK